jgi:DNA-binding Lrp family transcriptional regulator
MMVEAFVLINVNLGCETEIMRGLRKLHGFKEVFYVWGDYDIIAKVSARTIDELNQIVVSVRNLRNVRATSTMITRKL